MRLLLYVEPHPIRDSMTSFGQVASFFAGMLQNGGNLPEGTDLRIFGNREILELTARRFPSCTPFLLWPTENEQAAFASQLVPWIGSGIEVWKQLAAGEGPSDSYGEILTDLWSRYPFEAVVHWGANGAVARFCADRGLGRVVMELGCTRPPYRSTIVFDPIGVNGEAAPSLVDISDLAKSVGAAAASSTLDLVSYSERDDEKPHELQYRHSTELDEHVLGLARGRPIAFLPLQLHDDANLLLYSRFSSPADLVEKVVPALSEVGYFCFVKPHPAMVSRPGGRSELYRLRQAIHGVPDAHCLEESLPPSLNPRLFALSDLIVTVNSSVGFEATLHDKPVCVLGRAVYRPSGVFPSLEEIARHQFDQGQYRKHLSALKRFFLDAYLVPQSSAFELEVFMKRVQFLTSKSAWRAADATDGIYKEFGGSGRVEIQRQLLTPTLKPSTQLTPTVAPFVAAIPPSSPVTKGGRLWHRYKTWRARRVIKRSGLFDSEFYLSENPDVARAGFSPLKHYLKSGAHELRNPNPKFDAKLYVQIFAESSEARENPLFHYIRCSRGWKLLL